MTYSRRKFIVASLAFSVSAREISAQCASIDLGVPNIQQQTPVWCWAAVAQQLIFWKNGWAPQQCELVEIAYGAPQGSCCSGNPQCFLTGSLSQIQYLIGNFGGALSTISMPGSPQQVYGTLSQGKPIIMAVQSSPFSGHVVVINGISCFGTDVMLHINDPLSWGMFSSPVPFMAIMPFWQAAIVLL